MKKIFSIFKKNINKKDGGYDFSANKIFYENKNNNFSAGFTLIELLIVIAIISTIAVTISLNLMNYSNRQSLDSAAVKINAFLRDAQNRSLTQEGGNQWGIHFANNGNSGNMVELFSGSNFSSGTVVSVYNLAAALAFIDPDSGSSKDIIFSKITGYPDASTSVVFSLKNNPTQAYTVTVSGVGQVAENFGTIVITTRPDVPSSLALSPNDQQIILNWNAPASDGGLSITNYKIYRGNSPGGESYLTTIGNVLTNTDMGLTNGLTYYYQVSAVNAKGEGTKSGEASAVPNIIAPPAAGLVATANNSSGSYVDTSFDLSAIFTSSQAAVTSCQYTINGGTNWNTATVSGTNPTYTCSQTGITSSDGTVLTLNMRATNSGGMTTATSVARTVDGLAPSDGNLTTVSGDGQASLSWTAATDTASGLAASSTYKLVFSASSTPAANCSNGNQIYSGTGLSYNHIGLTNGSTYYYRLCAYDAVGNVSTGDTDQATPSAAGRYWIAGTGNWNDTAHWSLTPGGASGAPMPTSTDNVYFNANSFSTSSQVVTINVPAMVKNMNWTGATKSPILSGSSTLNIAGSLTFISGMTVTYATMVTFSATSTGQTISLAGKMLAGGVTFNGVGGGWTLQDTFSSNSNNINLTAGSLNTNNQNITTNSFSSSGANTSLALGSSTITCTKTYNTGWSSSIASSSFNAGTSQIILKDGATFSGGGLTYNNLVLNNVGTVTISGANTFNNLTRTGTGSTDVLSLSANQTVNGILSINGNSVANRLLVTSDTNGTPRTLTAATVSSTRVDFKDIVAAGGAAPFSGTSLGDALGNSNINFTGAVTRYWVGNGGSWNTTTHWAATSNGASGASIPLPQDTVIFDANSIPTSTVQTITTNMPRLGEDIDFSGVAHSPILSFGSTGNTIYGSLTLGSTTISGTNALTFSSRSPVNLTNAGRTFTNAITIDAPGGEVIMQDDFKSNSTTTLTRGTLTANNKNITAAAFSSNNSNTRAINMGSGTWTATGFATVWDTGTATNLTLNQGDSTLQTTYSGGNAMTITAASKPINHLKITAGTGTVTLSNVSCDDLDWTGFSGTWANGAITVAGNFTLSSGMTATGGNGTLTLTATSSKAITSNGKVFDRPVTMNGSGGAWTLQDDLVMSAGQTLTLTSTSTFDANNKNVTCGLFSSSNSNTRTINMGNGTWRLAATSTATLWNTGTATNLTLNSASSTIDMTSTSTNALTFAGGGKTYYNVQNISTGLATTTISGADTFNNFTVSGAKKTIIWTKNTTYTFKGTFSATGAASNLITFKTDTGGTVATLSAPASSTISCNYLSIKDSTTTGGASWHAGANSTSTGNNNWIFP